MNGEPLPAEHGYPVRLVVPGLYGYVSATKWVTEIELTTLGRLRRLLGPAGVGRGGRRSRRSTRIDTAARAGRRARADGVIAIAGAGLGGAPRDLARSRCRSTKASGASASWPGVPSDDTWRQWRYRWSDADTR